MTKVERMFSLVQAQKSSGLGKRAYSESIGMKYATFQYWCKRYSDANTALSSGDNSSSGNFVSLQELLRPSMSEQSYTPTRGLSAPAVVAGVVITMPSGVRIELR